ncbi:MAG: hypothetical protein AAF138_04420 [Planctomycetota bacterium]
MRLGRWTKFCALAWLTPVLGACAVQEDRDALLDFLSADSETEAMSHIADDFALTVQRPDGSLRGLDRAQLEDAVGWNAATNTRYEYRDLWFEGKKAQAVFSETSDFYRLLDEPGWEARLTFRFNDDHKIHTIDYQPISDHAGLGARMSQAIAWAQTNRPNELAAIYANNEIPRDRETARRWVQLLQDWRAATGQPAVELGGS